MLARPVLNATVEMNVGELRSLIKGLLVTELNLKGRDPATIEDDTRAGTTWKGKVVHISDWFTQRRSILMEPLQVNDVRTLECLIELVEPHPQPPLRIGQRVRVRLGS